MAVAVFFLLLPGSLALAGSKGQGQALVINQGAVAIVQPVKSLSGWNQGKKTGWQKKGAVIPPGHLKKSL